MPTIDSHIFAPGNPKNAFKHRELNSPAAWAPVIRSTQNHCILPLFGLEFNPYHFLLKDLEAKYPGDWFRAANNREKRWLEELKYLFPETRWTTNDRNLKLKENGKVLTDIDFAVFNGAGNELVLFQLKWQHAVGSDDRRRRSAGKNLIEEGNKWIETTASWLETHGVEELGQRLGMRLRTDTSVVLLVIGRYQSMFAGYENRDHRATWLDWNHFVKLRSENPIALISSLAKQAKIEQAATLSSYPGDFYAIPVRDLTVIVEPRTE